MNKLLETSRRLIGGWLLCVILLIAALLRFSHADWDGGYQLHPDERAILFVAQSIKLPDKVSKLFDVTTSPLNPFRDSEGVERAFPYGHLPLYLTAITGGVLANICSDHSLCALIPPASFLGRLLDIQKLSDFDHLTYVGRAISALFDTLTVFLTFQLANTAYRDQRSALLAAAILSLAVLHIQNAHFGTVDTALTFFCTLAIWLMVRFASSRNPRDSVLAGIVGGFAVGCKVTAVLLAIPMTAAYVCCANLRSHHTPVQFSWKTARTLCLTVLAAALAFAITNPYALLDSRPFLNDLASQLASVSGQSDSVFMRQYVGTAPILYAVEQQARWLWGTPLTLVAYLGLAWGTWNVLTTSADSATVMTAWAWTGVLLSLAFAKFPRYMMPMSPSFVVIVAGLLTIPPSAAAWLKRVLSGAVLASMFVYALAFDNMYNSPHPWVAASRWIYQNIASGSKLESEEWDDTLPLDLSGNDGYFVRASLYHTQRVDPFSEPDDPAKLARLTHALASSDYLILSSNRLYGVILRLGQRYPLTSTYYRLLLTGQLGYGLERSWYRYPGFEGWLIVDDPFVSLGQAPAGFEFPGGALNGGLADESFTVYDHPLVLLLHNDRQWTETQLEDVILNHSNSYATPTTPGSVR